jgi:hypothetical protein
MHSGRFILARPALFGYLLAVLVLLGCSITGVTRVYPIPHGTLVLTDDLNLIREACRDVVTMGTVIGCYQPSTQTIYCSGSDLATCGHELLHHVGLVHEAFEHDSAPSTGKLGNDAAWAVPN